ncbi:L-threonylcarbamoyladenylate synthase [Hoeflea prorocentri]|uniref:Threonylcarbamoyl-AMP synthase n=1 Tax=Hoeflea prorocentri TaxID=1922333 RepID=A0A9X3UJR8_9HYPH|nr:L-threonylcarbamoyladenylate synthase [Hoeflea prorocentri]MCY6381695.1 L-threonylcarbamoyladenylate synthase [Hoeflea prorocentri]MDA5399495.1 L-threonylcarbamoyladenylate synthase [Hoeflea prorocentri]
MTILDISHDENAALRRASAVLATGGLVALPTETVYGLAADATQGEAVARIFEAKGRPRFNPLICHMADIDMARRYVSFDGEAFRLADAFWPGPLTLVLPLKPDAGIHPLTTAGLDTLAVRVPTGFANRLIASYGHPLAAPSANMSGRISSTSAAHVEADLGDKVGLILDAGPAQIGLESTILKPTNKGIELLRPGGLAANDIESAIGAPLLRKAKADAAVEAPGMLRSHYAPGNNLRINAQSARQGDAVITFAGQTLEGAQSASLVLDLSPSGDLNEAATNLFDYMKRADQATHRDIVVASVPRSGLGEAINDRLERAAAPKDQSR